METIKSILDNLFKKTKPGSENYHIFKVWEGAVGARIARHSQPKRFRDHTLWVIVDNSIWMQQLKFLEEKIKERLNQRLGSAMVKKIRFQIGEINVSPAKDSEKSISPEWLEIEIDDNARKEIAKEVAVLKDGELKARLISLFQKHTQFKTYQGKE